MSDSSAGVCGPDSNSIACHVNLQPVERLCVTLKPPPFPDWLNNSEVQNYKKVCSSWQAYEDICLHGRGLLRYGVESLPMSPTTWIAPGIAFSASAILIIGTVVAYLLHRKYRSAYTVDKLQFRTTLPSGHHGDGVEKVESYSVTIVSRGKTEHAVERGEHNISVNTNSDVAHEPDIAYKPVTHQPDITRERDVAHEPDVTHEHVAHRPDITHDKSRMMPRLELSLDQEYLTIMLPNVVPLQELPVSPDVSPDFSHGHMGKSESREPIRPTGRVYEVGYVNAAYDGSDVVKEGRSPKKKKKSRIFLGDRKAASGK